MRTKRVLRAGGVRLVLAPVFLLAAVFLLNAMAAETNKPVAGGDLSAQRLVQSALKAEVLGDNESRQVFLRAAIEREPDYAPARWALGQIRVGERWLPLEEAESAAATSEDRAEYRRLRRAQGGSAEGELVLARWCEEHGLVDRAPVHWMNVLRFNPEHREALKKLEMRRYRGQWMTPEQIEEAERASAESKPCEGRALEANRHPAHEARSVREDRWRRAVNGWYRALEREDRTAETALRDAVQAIAEESELPILDEAVRQRCRKAEDKPEVLHRLGLAVLHAVEEHPTLSPLGVLMVDSVDHPLAAVRAAAAEGLKKYPPEQYVPVLIGQMDTPVEAHFYVRLLPGGSVVSRFSFFKRGPEGDSERVEHQLTATELTRKPIGMTATELVRTPIGIIDSPRDRAVSVEWPATAVQLVLAGQGIAYSKCRECQAATAAINARNVDVLERNRRLRDSLVRATGTDQGEDPVDWYNWWVASFYDYYEYEQQPHAPEENPPVHETTVYRSETRYVDVVSCFPPGTVVWTETGSAPIETVVSGDRVLSQDPITGELSFQDVLQTSRRNPTAMIRIQMGSEEILATRGHPFWVLGQGWTMAKHLEPGMRLHAVRGAVTVDRVEEIPLTDPATPLNYNLVVAGFGTYFVGQERLLVHDLRLFQHGTLSAPGLLEEEQP